MKFRASILETAGSHLEISDDLSWSLFVHNHSLDRTKCGAL